MFKKHLPLVIFLVLFLLMPTVSAQPEAEFSLSHEATEQNRIFYTTLSANVEVAAFVAHLEFDENLLEFRQVKAFDKTAELSVNHSDFGKLSVAFLCENGAKGELLSFGFKAKPTTTEISLKVSQVIDFRGNDLPINKSEGAVITVNAQSSSVKSQEANAESGVAVVPENTFSHSGTALSQSASPEEMFISASGKGSSHLRALLCFIACSAVLAAVAAVAFSLGRRTAEDNN